MNTYPWLEDYLSQKPGALRDYKLEWKWDRWQVGGKLLFYFHMVLFFFLCGGMSEISLPFFLFH